MTIWLAAREYAGIAEAGGVKNVVCSLAESLVALGHKVVVFMPLYACTNLRPLESFECVWHRGTSVCINSKSIMVTYSHGTMKGVEFVFIGNKAFSEKHAVYTYTQSEMDENPAHVKGNGHEDALFLDCLFQKSAVAYANTCNDNDAPDIFHCQDACSALIPSFIQNQTDLKAFQKNFYSKTKCVVTIHNAGPGYHHEFWNFDECRSLTGLPEDFLKKGINGYNGNCIEPFILASENSVLTTVSPQYAKEIEEGKTDTAGLTQMFNERNIKVIGITNGIDYESYNPLNKKVSCLPFTFNPPEGDFEGKIKCRQYFLKEYAGENDTEVLKEAEEIQKYGWLSEGTESTAYFVFHGRLVTQKGIDVLCPCADQVLSEDKDVRFIFIGQGQKEKEDMLIDLATRHKGKCVYFKGYHKALSRLCIASADFTILPSFFEPCCLEDFIAQIYGTIPIAHATGGLCKIIPTVTGYLFEPDTSEEIYGIIDSICKIQNCSERTLFFAMKKYAAQYVKQEYSWEKVSRDFYIPLFESLL